MGLQGRPCPRLPSGDVVSLTSILVHLMMMIFVEAVLWSDSSPSPPHRTVRDGGRVDLVAASSSDPQTPIIHWSPHHNKRGTKDTHTRPKVQIRTTWHPPFARASARQLRTALPQHRESNGHGNRVWAPLERWSLIQPTCLARSISEQWFLH